MVSWNGPKVGRQALCLYIFFGDVLRAVGSACLEPHKTCLLILRLEVAEPRVRLQSISTLSLQHHISLGGILLSLKHCAEDPCNLAV